MTKSATHYRWDEVPLEKVNDMLDRKLITGDRMMIAHVYLKKDCVVPKHSHENEQLTYILEGALLFTLGEEQYIEVTVSAGEVLHLPSNYPHMAVGLEGRVAFVAAASKGLGRAVAEELAAEGVNLFLCARGDEALQQTASEIA